mmetsp:Transcript_86510/g.166539  ORF Transcript_86510/g.166539 Transcript_86510/m.166539 type:complete len:218 (+) Transcript_86510:1125-1778(+)
MTRGSCSCQETTCLLYPYSCLEAARLPASLAASPGCIAQTSAMQRSGRQTAASQAAEPETCKPQICAADACNTRVSDRLHTFLPGYMSGQHRVEGPHRMPGHNPPPTIPVASATIPHLSTLQECHNVAATEADDLPSWQHGLPPRGLCGVPPTLGIGPGGFFALPPAPGVQLHNKLQLLQSLQFPSSTVSHHRELHRFAGQGVHKPLLFPPPCSRAG